MQVKTPELVNLLQARQCEVLMERNIINIMSSLLKNNFRKCNLQAEKTI